MDKEMFSIKSVRLLSFDGTAKLFQMWWLWFLPYAPVYGFMQSMQHSIDFNLPDREASIIDETDAAAAVAIKKAKRSNTIVMASFTMAFTSESLIGMVYAAMTTDWPSGLAYKIMVALHEKYVPQDMVAKIELRRALSSVLMKRKDDPVDLFEQFSELQN
eukprot:6650871-Ditylum_brightwellii.AAC.1